MIEGTQDGIKSVLQLSPMVWVSLNWDRISLILPQILMGFLLISSSKSCHSAGCYIFMLFSVRLSDAMTLSSSIALHKLVIPKIQEYLMVKTPR
jgi:hypothetical protein